LAKPPKAAFRRPRPPDLEDLFGCAIEGDEPPIRVEGEKSFRDPFQDFIDRQLGAVRGRARRGAGLGRRFIEGERRV